MNVPLSQPRYALVVRVPRAVEVRIEDLYLSLVGSSRPIMGFHITLLGPFLWSTGPDEALLARTEALCLQWQPFAVTIGGLDAFYGEGENGNAVYIRVLDQETLLSVHSALHAIYRPAIILQREFPPAGYMAHITLGLGLNAGERDRMLADGAHDPLAATFQVSELHLVEEQPNAPWRSIRVFRFGGQPAREPYEIHER